jgi:hypothetical protein
VRVLRDLAHERLAVGLGHPVPRLDALVSGDRLVEPRLQVVHEASQESTLTECSVGLGCRRTSASASQAHLSQWRSRINPAAVGRNPHAA